MKYVIILAKICLLPWDRVIEVEKSLWHEKELGLKWARLYEKILNIRSVPPKEGK